MTSLRLTLFGPFQASLEDRPLPSFRTAKVQALLVYLVVEPGRHSRESLMELLWPGMPERSARHNLRQVLYYLRGAIPDLRSNEDGRLAMVPLLLANRQMIRLNAVADVSADVAHFEALVGRTQEHDHPDLLVCMQCRRDLQQAVELYRGDFLADFYLVDSNAYENWSQIMRESYRRKVLDALEILTTIASRQKEYPDARTLAERQLEIDNLREGGYRQLMEALALSGRREEALSVYENCRRLLTQELGMKPASRTTELYENILAGDLTFDSQHTPSVRGYELKEEIGGGAFGTIHRAIQPSVGREVAIKVIQRRYANNPEFIRRFEDEAQTIARLEHPFIVPLYDYWREPDGAYLVMRHLRGGSLLSALEDGPWEPEQAAGMLDQVASALSAAHSLGIIHRDVKPANILMDENGNAYLSDFGIARNLEEERRLTSAGAVMGTPDYISPEQILNEQVGPESDQYAMGAVLFETLTGEKPYGDSSVANLLYKHLNEPFPLVSASRPGLPSQIDAVIQKATAKRPADRYADVVQMAEAFRQAIAGEEGPRRTSTPYTIPQVAALYNPYKGLQAFQEADAEDFFGREALVERLVERLAPVVSRSGAAAGSAQRFLAVVGPSGSGKSSVVKAGLIPALRSGAVTGSERWFVAEMVPGTHPLEELEMALWPVAVDPPPSLVEPMQRDVRGMLRTIRRILPEEVAGDGASRSSVSDSGRPQLLLFIDQFEELFTLVEDAERRTFFLDSLLAAISAPRSPLRVIITLRADFYDRPLQFQKLGQIIKENTEIVLPLAPEELTWAIREPARRVGAVLEEGLPELIIVDVSDQPGGLPLLQYALTELYEQRENNRLSLAGYQAIGGVRGALGRRAEALYEDFDEAAQESVRHLFLRLVTLGEGIEDTRRRVLRSELQSLQGHGNGHGRNVLNEILDAYGAARLLTFDHDPLSRTSTVEVAHEALLREWGRLRRWLDEGRDEVRLQQQLAQAAADWLNADKDKSYLLRGARLAQFEGWASDSSLALAKDESAFLTASVGARESRQAEEEERRQRELATVRQLAETEKARAETEARAAQRLRQRAYVLAGVVLLSVTLAVVAALFGREASQNAELAHSRELAASSAGNLDIDPELSLLLATQALSTADTEQARQALHSALLTSRVRQRLIGHQESIPRLAYSPDGRFIALASNSEEKLTIWDATSSQLLHEIRIARCCWGLYFDDESRRLAAAEPGGNFALAIYDVSTGEKLESFSLPIPASSVGFYYLHPDWTRIAFHLGDGRVEVWDLLKRLQLFELQGHSGSVELEYSKDGRRLVSYDWARGLVMSWDAHTGELLRRIETNSQINDHAVSPDGRRVALAVDIFGPQPWEVQIYDLEAPTDDEEPRPIARLPATHGTIRLIDFSADGEMIASAGRDGTSIVWDSWTGETLYVLQHGTHVRSVAFHPDGNALLSSDVEGVARVWDITPRGAGERLGLRAHDEPIYGGELSPDGKTFVTASYDGTAAIWDMATGAPVHRLEGHSFFVFEGQNYPYFVEAAAFHPDGRRIATASQDGTARVWDTATGKELIRIEGHEEIGTGSGPQGVLDVDFSPDGELLATAGADSTARIWDAETGVPLMVLEGHTAALRALVFSPDGRLLATAQDSGRDLEEQAGVSSVRIWEVETGRELLFIDTDHGDRVLGVAFSPDGRFLATSGGDAQSRIWALDLEAGSAQLLATLSGHVSSVRSVRFSPDGRTLATAAPDEIRIWDVSALYDTAGQPDEVSVAELLVLPGGPGLSFSEDGGELITAGIDGLLRVYVFDPEALLSLGHSRLTRWWTEDECRRFLHLDACPAAPKR